MGKALSISDIGMTFGGLGRALSSLRGAERRREGERSAADRREALQREERRRELFEREALPHMDALYSFAVRMTADQTEAQDLVQETYLKAFRFFDKFEQGTNCKAWLFRIMKNSYINRYRRTRKVPQIVGYDAVEDLAHLADSQRQGHSDPAGSFFDNILGDEVTIAIERLPEDFRTVVILSDIEGFTYEEIAGFVDCPVGTVRSRLHRGRRLLREALMEYAAGRGYLVAENTA